jgi:hypothetical protein
VDEGSISYLDGVAQSDFAESEVEENGRMGREGRMITRCESVREDKDVTEALN